MYIYDDAFNHFQRVIFSTKLKWKEFVQYVQSSFSWLINYSCFFCLIFQTLHHSNKFSPIYSVMFEQLDRRKQE